MTQYLLSALVDGQHLSFDAIGDQLFYDGAAPTAANVRVVQISNGVSLTPGAKTVFLDGLALANLSTGTIIFADVSTLFVGDLGPSTYGDFLPPAYVSPGSVTDDQYLLLNGASQVIAGSGKDWIAGSVDQTGVVQVTQAGGNSTVYDIFLKDRADGSLTRVSSDMTGAMPTATAKRCRVRRWPPCDVSQRRHRSDSQHHRRRQQRYLSVGWHNTGPDQPDRL